MDFITHLTKGTIGPMFCSSSIRIHGLATFIEEMPWINQKILRGNGTTFEDKELRVLFNLGAEMMLNQNYLDLVNDDISIQTTQRIPSSRQYFPDDSSFNSKVDDVQISSFETNGSQDKVKPPVKIQVKKVINNDKEQQPPSAASNFGNKEDQDYLMGMSNNDSDYDG